MPNRDTLGSREPNRKKEERRKKKALCRRLQRKMAREFITRIGRRSARGFQSRLATQRGRLGGPNALSCRPRLPLRRPRPTWPWPLQPTLDRKSTRLNSSHQIISYAVFCLKKKKKTKNHKTNHQTNQQRQRNNTDTPHIDRT